MKRTSSGDHKRAVYHVEDAAVAFRDSFASAVVFQSPLDIILKDRERITGMLAKKTTQTDRAYLRGYWDALFKEHSLRYLVYGGYVDETWYSVHDNRPDYYGKHIEPSTWLQVAQRRGHYYVSDDGKKITAFSDTESHPLLTQSYGGGAA